MKNRLTSENEPLRKWDRHYNIDHFEMGQFDLDQIEKLVTSKSTTLENSYLENWSVQTKITLENGSLRNFPVLKCDTSKRGLFGIYADSELKLEMNVFF